MISIFTRSWRAIRFGGLRSRALLLLAAAVLPIVLMVLVVAIRAHETSRQTELAGIARDAGVLAARVDAVPAGSARLASLTSLSSSWDADFASHCAARLAAILKSTNMIESIAVFRGGRMTCRARDADAPADAAFLDALRPENMLTADAWEGFIGSGEGRRIALAASAGTGANRTSAVLVISRAALGRSLAIYRARPSTESFLVDDSGAVLASSGAVTRTGLVGLPARPFASEPAAFLASGPDGAPTVLAMARLGALPAWLVTKQGAADVFARAREHFWSAAAAPLLVLAAAAAAFWLGLSNLVLRWIRHMRGTTRAFVGGDGAARIGPCPGAPRELAELARNFDQVGDAMAVHAANLERAIVERQRHLREYHHRVKNMLQIIASMLALQRRYGEPAARGALRGVEDRVHSMAGALAAAYHENEHAATPLDRLIADVAHRMLNVVTTDGATPEIIVAPAPERVDLDTAIALGMLLAELLPPLIDEAARRRAPISLTVLTGESRWRIVIDGPPAGVSRNPLSQRLANAHLRKLDATLDETVAGRIVIDLAARPA